MFQRRLFTAAVSAFALVSFSSGAFAANFGFDQFQNLKNADRAIHLDKDVNEFLKDADHHVLPEQRVSSDEIETTKFQHYFKGLEVIGSMAFHHFTKSGELVQEEMARFDINDQPLLSANDANALAQGLVGERQLSKLPELKVLPTTEGAASLIYHVVLSSNEVEGGRELFVDAHSGEILADIPRDLELAPVQVFSTTGKTLIQGANQLTPSHLEINNESDLSKIFAYSFPGKKMPTVALTPDTACQVVDSYSGYPTNITLANCDKVVANSVVSVKADESAKRAFSNSQKVLTYFQNTHRRNSFDGRGSEVKNVVHIGSKFANAFWSQDFQMMAYGDGDGKMFADFTQALDVSGHEMTHGVVSTTAKLIYQSESGALNEAMADFFGKMIANDGDWAIGKAIFKDPNSKGIRDLANPGNLTFSKRDSYGNVVASGKYPSKMSEKIPSKGMCNRDNDNCWVHINSTIPGHGMYLVVNAIGKEKAEKLFYTVLTQFLTASSDFKKFSTATQTACKQLFEGATCTQVQNAFTSIGL